MWSMIDPCILITSASRLIKEDFKDAIQEGTIHVTFVRNSNFEGMLPN